jgi:hypothetical protein
MNFNNVITLKTINSWISFSLVSGEH